MRLSVAVLYVLAGALHFVRPRMYEAIVPPPLDRHKELVVAASGVAEVAGGLLAAPARTRRVARWWLLATLAGVFPANVWMALEPARFRAIPSWTLWARLPVQGLFAWHVWRGTR